MVPNVLNTPFAIDNRRRIPDLQQAQFQTLDPPSIADAVADVRERGGMASCRSHPPHLGRGNASTRRC